ncbi:hypothetical protein BGZ95_007365, partial [Linnemannia exigua]
TQFTSALVICLGLVAKTQAEDIGEVIGGISWPTAFASQCKDLYAISGYLDKQIAEYVEGPCANVGKLKECSG